MELRPLGKSGLRTSAMAVGTVSLGKPYGIEQPGEYGAPLRGEVHRTLHRAADSGVTLYDTAPDYGEAETLLGSALGDRPHCLFATKVTVPRDDRGQALRGFLLRDALFRSIDQSCSRLKRDVLDIVQVHKARPEELIDEELLSILIEAQRAGKVRILGASTYGEAEALTVLERGGYQLCQVAYNLLDRRMERTVFPAAVRNGKAILARSPYLKGALTEKVGWLPKPLLALGEAIKRTHALLDGSMTVSEAAVRFCLSNPSVASVLVGVRTERELSVALAAMEAGPLPDSLLRKVAAEPMLDENLLNPSTWPMQ